MTADDASSLFHEMVHAYQAWQLSEEDYYGSSANRELEAYLAEYRFAGDITSSKYRANIMRISKDYLSKNGTLKNLNEYDILMFNETYMNTIDLITNQYRMYGQNLTFAEKTPDQNFKNLANITKNCP